MPGNTIGQLFRVTTFGESHGGLMGVLIDGCPPGLELNLEKIQRQLDRRRPGQSKITTQRKESDAFRFVSGLHEGKTLGTPLVGIIPNEDAQPGDYSHLKAAYRPSHADYTYEKKYGVRDYRGGGRSSARETACRVIAGAVAMQWLQQQGLAITAYVSSAGVIKLDVPYTDLDLSAVDKNIVRCPDEKVAEKMIRYIEQLRDEGDTTGGVISCVIQNCPVGLGEPVFDKLHADLAKAMVSINAVKGFEIGSGFEGTAMKGSEHNDAFVATKGKISTKTNFSGGVQGGISNGMDIYFNVAFKPVSTLMKDQNSVDSQGDKIVIAGKGRHDPCVLPRAVPVVEAMAAIVLADHLLRQQSLTNSVNKPTLR